MGLAVFATLFAAVLIWPDNSATYVQLIFGAFWFLAGWRWAQRKYAPHVQKRQAERLGTWIGTAMVKVAEPIARHHRRTKDMS